MSKLYIENTKTVTNLKKSDFYYDLPDELIAQSPSERRDFSRLLAIDRQSGELSHKHFYDILEMLRPQDAFVINESKVIPARLFGTDTSRPHRKIEFLLLRQREGKLWEAICRPGKHAKIGARFDFGAGLFGEVENIKECGNRLIRFEFDGGAGDIFALLDKVGSMPLPPYITQKLTDNSRYQTVYAKVAGSAAAPTAGLHLTQNLLQKIKEKGCAILSLSLHVGLGTFRPVKSDFIKEHHMHSEQFSISGECAEEINRRRALGGRIIAVGTTVCRVLESVASESGEVRPLTGETDIFIYPEYKFKAVDALITNFHLPESTLLMLVSAFAGREQILSAYKTAIDEKYRFFSFGDAMFIY